jgi:hypothetical protein
VERFVTREEGLSFRTLTSLDNPSNGCLHLNAAMVRHAVADLIIDGGPGATAEPTTLSLS